MAGDLPKPTDQELKTATEVLRWMLDQAGPIRITIEPATGDGQPTARVDRTSPEHGRPGDGSPGVAGAPTSAPGDVPLDLIASEKAATEKARQLLRAYGYNKPEWILREYRPERIIEICMQIPRQKRKVKDPGAWINAALGRKFRWRAKG